MSKIDEILGEVWADGWIYHKQQSGGKNPEMIAKAKREICEALLGKMYKKSSTLTHGDARIIEAFFSQKEDA